MQKQAGHRDRVTVRVDGYTRFCLTAIAVLLTALIAMLWVEAVPSVPRAEAVEGPFLNTAAQRDKIIKAQEATTAKLDAILEFLKSGELEVQVAEPEIPVPGGADRANPKPKP